VEAVSRERIDALVARAQELAGAGDSRTALLDWLNDVVTYCVSARGLAAALTYEGAEPESIHENSCATAVENAGRPLLRRAVRDGAVDAEITVADLIALAVGVVLATEHHADQRAAAERLFGLAVEGLSPRTT
jgi:hypothetical protein